jgi:hypothetical protein
MKPFEELVQNIEAANGSLFSIDVTLLAPGLGDAAERIEELEKAVSLLSMEVKGLIPPPAAPTPSKKKTGA